MKTLKYVLSIIVAYLLGYGIWYLITVFLVGIINPLNWETNLKLYFIVLGHLTKNYHIFNLKQL